MTWPKTGATHYHEQLRLPDKGREIKELVVCWMLPNLLNTLIHWAIKRITLQFTLRLFSIRGGTYPPRSNN